VWSTRSVRKHKAWGGAKRNPRNTGKQKNEIAEVRQRLRELLAVARVAGSFGSSTNHLGFRFAPPQALC
jgi:hypothetical protein